MISVVSPPFIRSGACRGEVEQFWRIAEQTGGQWVEDKARLLKVLKTAVSEQEIPPSLADIFSPLLGFEFFELDPQTGRIREFDETFGPILKQRFFEDRRHGQSNRHGDFSNRQPTLYFRLAAATGA